MPRITASLPGRRRTSARQTVSRTVAITAAAALLGGGVVAVSASTAGTASAAECRAASKDSKKDLSTVGVTHDYAKSVAMTAGAGSKVTYKIDVSTNGIGNPYVHSVVDVPPSGFSKPTAKVRAFHVVGGLKEESVPVVADGKGWKVANSGWMVNSSNPLTVSFTYNLPLSSVPGVPVTSGGIAVTGTAGVSHNFPDLTACYLTRVMSPGEAIGSVGDDLSSSGSTQSIISDITSGIVGGVLDGAGS